MSSHERDALLEAPTGRPQRIVYLTAGAAGMYCGSCLRDTALARALIRAGRDVQLVPTYTPLTADQAGPVVDQVFLGGINVYLQQRIGLLQYLPRWVDRWLSHPAVLRRFTSGPRKTDPRMLGDLTLSVLRGTDGRQAKEFRHLVEWIASQRIDLVDLSNFLIAGCLPELRRLGIPLVVTIQGDDLFLDKLPPTHRDEAWRRVRELSAYPDGVIVYSEFYRRRVMESFGVPAERLYRVRLGIETGDFLSWERPAGLAEKRPPVLGFLARLSPEKGFDRFVDVLLALRRLPGLEDVRGEALGSWGDDGRDYIEAERRRAVEAAGDAGVLHVEVNASREEKLAFLRRIDCLCVPTRYEEPKGLFVLESLAAGVPVVLPRHGAFPELIESLGGGVLVPPGDFEELVRATARLLRQSDARAAFGAAGRRAVLATRSADVMARETANVYDSVTHARAGCRRAVSERPPQAEKEGKTS